MELQKPLSKLKKCIRDSMLNSLYMCLQVHIYAYFLTADLLHRDCQVSPIYLDLQKNLIELPTERDISNELIFIRDYE